MSIDTWSDGSTVKPPAKTKARMSDRTPDQQDISQLTDDQKKAAGWEYTSENPGTCIECGTRIAVENYSHQEKGLASVRTGCQH